MDVLLNHTVDKYLPDRNLAVLKPLYIIEPASPAECKKIEKRVKEYHENPASFVPWRKGVKK
jgi:hypothetical protein